MLGTFLIFIGILIGWNLPQPKWAKAAQDKLVAKIKEKFSKKEEK